MVASVVGPPGAWGQAGGGEGAIGWRASRPGRALLKGLKIKGSFTAFDAQDKFLVTCRFTVVAASQLQGELMLVECGIKRPFKKENISQAIVGTRIFGGKLQRLLERPAGLRKPDATFWQWHKPLAILIGIFQSVTFKD